MAFDLSSVLGSVSELNTREQIEYIALDKIESDERNFYGLRNIDELAANIEFAGLQQPIRVRPVKGGKYVIVSGHRRYAAVSKLAEDNAEKWGAIPAIVESGAGSAELQELRLIMANSDTRAMNSAEISKQAERVQELLYQLKEQGVEFPGRMRDHVAEACKISASKLARLTAIRNNLTNASAKAAYETGEVSENQAYELSRLSPAMQDTIVIAWGKKHDNLRFLYADMIRKAADDINCIKTPKRCKGGCANEANKRARILNDRFANQYAFTSVCATSCCMSCVNLSSCRYSCYSSEGKKAELKAADQNVKRDAAERKAAEEALMVEKIKEIWQRFGALQIRKGITWTEYMDLCDAPYPFLSEREAAAYERGDEIDLYTILPFCSEPDLPDTDALCRAADLFGVSVDYLLCRTDEPVAPVQASPGTAPEWRTVFRDEPEDGQLVILRDSGDLYSQPARYIDGRYYMDPFSVVPEMDIEVSSTMRWLPVPEPPMEDENEE